MMPWRRPRPAAAPSAVSRRLPIRCASTAGTTAHARCGPSTKN